MFGYVAADPGHMDTAQFVRYRGCYCGLCRALKERCGGACRLCLTYDITFLILLLSSLYEPEERSGCARCIAHPIRAHDWWQNELTRYGAYMNAALAYYNCLDDWQDDRNLIRLLQSALLRPAAKKAAARYPRQCEAMTRQLRTLSALERENAGVDALADAFGALMAELFVYEADDHWSPALRRFGAALGRLIYVLDAVCDLDGDRKKGRFNPLLSFGDCPPEHFRGHLTLLAADAAAEFERLPLVRDAGLLRNILYSGVWQKYDRLFAPAEKENPT